jgi:hypothetical protein
MKKVLVVATLSLVAVAAFGQASNPLPSIKGVTLGQLESVHVNDCHYAGFDSKSGVTSFSCLNPEESSELWLDYDKNNKLESIDYTVLGAWELMSPSLTAKFGKPSSVKTKVVQNGFGARFVEHHAMWVTNRYVVSADEGFRDDNTTKGKQVDIRYETRASFEAGIESLRKSVTGQLD